MTQPALVNPFALKGNWYKAALHAHTTHSDGRLSPPELARWYRERGYHLLNLSDHAHVTDARHLAAADFLLLRGVEWHGGAVADGTHYHLLLLDIQQPVAMPGGDSMQAAVDAARAAGALVFAAHPYWLGQTSRQIAAVEGLLGLEVYNDVCQVRWGLGLAAVHWDELLAQGRLFYGLAVDDIHDPDIEGDGGWTWIKAAELTPQAMRQALESGAFYASTGPVIRDIQVCDGIVEVHCSPVVSVGFMATAFYGRRVTAPKGQTIQQARYQLKGNEGYLRVECTAADGRSAWSNPVVWNF